MLTLDGIVYKAGETHYFTFRANGQRPVVPEGAERVFGVVGEVNDIEEFFQKARDEVKRRKLGRVVNLSD